MEMSCSAVEGVVRRPRPSAQVLHLSYRENEAIKARDLRSSLAAVLTFPFFYSVLTNFLFLFCAYISILLLIT